MIEKELIYLIALTKVPKVGHVLAKNLISYCGNIEAVFEEQIKNLVKIPGIGQQVATNIKNADFKAAEKEVDFIQKNNIQSIAYYQDEYPRRLKQIESCPTLIYYKGTNVLNHHRTVAIIGTRTPTESGKLICEKILEGLSVYNPLIISGLAYGIDGIAHKKAVQSEIPTVGVMGHGLDIIYPAEHKSLAQKMMLNGGVITEFPSQTKPDKENFPMRNRIIAAMSDVVIVVESKRKGGSIITAEIANDFNRDVFAVPGRITDEFSEGCNNLIKQNKAHLIESAKDVGYIMRWEEMDAEKHIQRALFVELDDHEKQVVQLLTEAKELSIDQLTYRTQLAPSAVSSVLIGLEFKGMIKSLPGKKYILY